MSTIVNVSLSSSHSLNKRLLDHIRLVAGLGVEGDAHAGVTVQHRSRVARDSSQPNLRQVRLIHSELFDELRALGFNVGPGVMGENITTRGIDLLGLPTGARLVIGEAVIEIAGLRNPCKQLESIAPGLMAALIAKDVAGNVVRKCGVMGIVVASGEVRLGDAIAIELPSRAHNPLEPV